ncbi:hypothetical protein RND71_015467 [Anisodus tanguticus]|uniref:Uncharacterized protein n=1 Tax=Anisodus tanguticus TaxID=243964 RepID=A0AAE1S4C9_9SOLA|nr:hypothetical protein RND71_015467 [Anisodus tanguticus]
MGWSSSYVQQIAERFTIGAEIIGEAIRKWRKDEEWIMNGYWLNELSAIDKNRTFSVAGSPKHDFYATDFSWGRPEILESVSIDSDNGVSMSCNRSRDSYGDLEIGLCLPKNRMNAFAAIFNHGLSFL